MQVMCLTQVDPRTVRARALGRPGTAWCYIGRGTVVDGVRLAPSALANPFRRGSGARGSTLDRYRRWLWQQLANPISPAAMALTQLTAETSLVCHCPQPGPCHGHVVMAAWRWTQAEPARLADIQRAWVAANADAFQQQADALQAAYRQRVAHFWASRERVR